MRAHLPYQRPYDLHGLLAWLAARAVPGIELVSAQGYLRTLATPDGPAVLEVRDCPERDALQVDLHGDGLTDSSRQLALRVARELFDTEADPAVVDAHLRAHPVFAPLVRQCPGIRLPGSAGLPEALLRALLGQQITVVQARRLLGAAAEHGPRLDTGVPGLHRLFPEPRTVALTASEWFRGPAARRAAVEVSMTAVSDLDHLTATDPSALRSWLLAQRGIGPWTADYVLMRALHHQDTVPSPDVALRAGARATGLGHDYHEIIRALEPLRPYRSYAALHLWRAAS